MSSLKVFKSTRSHPALLLNTSPRHFSQETIAFQCLAACSVWQGNIRRSSDKYGAESQAIKSHVTAMCWSTILKRSANVRRYDWLDRNVQETLCTEVSSGLKKKEVNISKKRKNYLLNISLLLFDKSCNTRNNPMCHLFKQLISNNSLMFNCNVNCYQWQRCLLFVVTTFKAKKSA